MKYKKCPRCRGKWERVEDAVYIGVMHPVATYKCKKCQMRYCYQVDGTDYDFYITIGEYQLEWTTINGGHFAINTLNKNASDPFAPIGYSIVLTKAWAPFTIDEKKLKTYILFS